MGEATCEGGSFSPWSIEGVSTGDGSALKREIASYISDMNVKLDAYGTDLRNAFSSMLQNITNLIAQCDLPVCKGDPEGFNAGFGPCWTYGPGVTQNYLTCSSDQDKTSKLVAAEVCPECGQCMKLTLV